MSQTLTHLSNQAIHALTKDFTVNQNICVQIIEFQRKKDKYYLILSDGFHTIKALPRDHDILNPETDLNAIISIKKHMVGKNYVVGIVEFEKLFNYKTKIGNPQEFNIDTVNPEAIETVKLQQSLIELKLQNSTKEQTIPKQNQMAHQSATIKKQEPNKIPETQRKFMVPSVPQPLSGNLKGYETIKDLWVGMDRWTIVCRIVKMDYSEFISKKSGKDTKVLNLELMDRTGMKISGAFFGEAALQFKDYLVKDRVYKISQAQIRQESYNNSKNQKLSPYKLVFTALSTFDEVSDTNSIAKNEDAAITLGDCVDRRIIGQEFDIVCILVNIEDPVEVKKDDRMLKKTNMLIADPLKNITLHALVWNENLIPDHSLIGKTIILSRFKLNEYKNSLSLSSVYKSSVIPVESHHYQQYEKQVMKDYASYEKLHEIKSSGNEGDYEVCTSIRELEDKMSMVGIDEWVRSELIVSLNRFSLKKWHYEGCPHCNKIAESLSSCQHCNKYIEKTIGHFIMGIEVCDSTGSMWTVAYDDFAKKIFGVTDQTEIINYFIALEANKLKEETEQFLYQEFKLRISSKKERGSNDEARIKHSVSKIYERNFAEETMKNIEMISKLSIS